MNTTTEKKFAAGLSIVSNSSLIVLKLVAGVISGSISIISEAIHSLSDLLASVLAFFAVSRSAEPADPEHTFGHGKYEDMAGFLEGALIIAAAFYIIYEAVKKIISGVSLDMESSLGIVVMALSVVVNYFVSKYLFQVAEKTESVALYADGEHLRTDVWSSLGVLGGLIVIKLTGLTILDPLIAIVVALIILKTGLSVSGKAMNNLLDCSLPKSEIAEIENILKAHTIEYKNLKSRRTGPARFVELVMLCPHDMTVVGCHKICDDIEKAIQEKLGNAEVVIHAEPE